MRFLPSLVVFTPIVACAAEGPRAETDTTATDVVDDDDDSGSGGDTGSATTGGGDVTSTTTADTGSTTVPEDCGEQTLELAAVPPHVMLVLDKSGSMLTEWDADGLPATPDLTRWNSLYNVVDFVVVSFDDEIDFGANLFPSVDATTQLGAGACVVEDVPEVPVAPTNALEVLMGIPPVDADDLRGATPATAGIQTALAHLLTLDPAVGRFMILVTDGAANCGAESDTSACPGLGCGLMEEYDTQLAQVVGDAFVDDGVPTYVVGIDILDELLGVGDDGLPEANTFEELNLVAIAGGKPRAGAEKFFNAQNENELLDALADIAGQVVTCVVPLDRPAPHPDFVEIQIGGMPYAHVDDCATEDGWVWVEPDGPYDAIELCGAACEHLAAHGTVDVTLGCPPAG